MNCKDIEKLLAAYVEEIASSEEKSLVENHLSSCQGCRKAFEQLKKAVALVKDLEAVESPPWFAQKVMARVTAEQETKKNVIERLFYPLHIKVPLEAFATVLIAVAAVYLFKANEPEMKRIHVPSVSEQAVSKEEAIPAEPKKDTTIAEEGVPVRKVPEVQKRRGSARDKDQQISTPAENEISSPPASEIGKEISEKSSGTSEPPTPHAQAYRESPAPAATDRVAKVPARGEKMERRVSSAAPQMTASTVTNRQIVDLILQTRDAKASSRDVEDILNQLGAQNIERESLQSTEILRAELQPEKIQELFEKLKLLGEIKEKGLPPEHPKITIKIRIEMMTLP